jgi:hypothetical protein
VSEHGEEGGRRRGKRDEVRVDAALGGAMAPLMRQIRKFSALHALIDALPEELAGLAAPYELRQAPRRGHEGEAGSPTLSTIYIYSAGPTVEAVIEQRSSQLIEEVNSKLPYPLVEALRCEQAPLAKIEKQLNILALRPD